MHTLTETVSQFWANIQGSLFPYLEDHLDPLTERQQQLIAVLEFVRVEQFIFDYSFYEGRPEKLELQ